MNIIGRSICIIGDRDAGKTTYLAALAYWHKNPTTRKIFNIKPVSKDAKILAAKAERIILKGESLEPTDPRIPLHQMPEYFFILETERRRKLLRYILEKGVTLTKRKRSFYNEQIETIQLFFRDFGGEMFEEIGRRSNNATTTFGTTIPDDLYKAFIQDCLKPDVKGCLVLLPNWGDSNEDKKYCRILGEFINLLERYNRANDYRIAVALSKCERGEIWTGRLEPEVDIFRRHLPMTHGILRNNRQLPVENTKFFAISTFGVLASQDPRPNRKTEVGTGDGRAVLREANKWCPYGLFSPLYWLSTGKRTLLE